MNTHLSFLLEQGILSVAVALIIRSTTAAELVAPVGAAVGPVEFEAVIEETSPSLLSHVTLFANYWVSSNSYIVGTVWAEPHGRGLNFPVYPPTLRIESNPSEFIICHDVALPVTNHVKKPLDRQTVFTNMLGDYTIANIRFAEESVASRGKAICKADRSDSIL